MSDHSAIQWTDATWNPTTGCTKISPGCAHCYIERTPAFRIAGNKFVRGKTDIEIFHDRLDQPLHWRKPRRVFVNSLSDLFHDDISDSFIQAVFTTMAQTPRHTYQVLTKRPKRMQRLLTAWNQSGLTLREGWGAVLPNVWLGVSVENQHFADERIPLLLQTPAAVRFISAEPVLDAVNLSRFLTPCHSDNPETGSEHSRIDGEATPIAADTQGPANMEAAAKHAGAIRQEADRQGVRNALDWVIVGGESGPGARAFDLAWARSILAQCRAAGVACFVKQLGAQPLGDIPAPLPRLLKLMDRKGGDIREWPSDLRIRNFPDRSDS